MISSLFFSNNCMLGLTFFKNSNYSAFNLIKNNFYTEFNKKGFFLKNFYMYYEFFFFSVSCIFFKKNIFFLNFIFLLNFKNFLNYFYNTAVLQYPFMILDNDYGTVSPFLHTCYSESTLIKYNLFFKKNSFFTKQLRYLALLKRNFFKKKITTLLILNYEIFYKHMPVYSSFNSTIVSFVLPNIRVDLLDFFFFKTNHFFYLEKTIFLSVMYSTYVMGKKIFFLKKFNYYKDCFNKINKSFLL